MQLVIGRFVVILVCVSSILGPIRTWSQPGDLCSSPISITLYDPITNPCNFVTLSGSGYNLGLFNSNTISGANPGCGFGSSNNDFWIRTQVPSNSDGVKIAISNPTGSNNDLSNFVVALYTGTSCSSLNYVSCKAGSTNTYFQYFDGLSPLQNVWLRFFKKNTTTGIFGDNFRIYLVGTNTIGSNDACNNAAPATYGTYCNYSATNKNEPGSKTPLGLTGNSTICNGGSFNSFDNNQWYYIDVDTSTIQPVVLNLRGVSCVGGAPRLQIGLWKAETNNCSLWGSGYNFTNSTTAGDGFLLACSVGTGTVTITKSLPNGKYWFTADGGSGSFCTYTLTASPGVLSVSFLDFALDQSGSQPHLKWIFARARDIDHFIVQSSADGKTFQPVEQIANFQTGVGTYHYSPSVLKTNENTFYRIQAVDKQGNTENSVVLQLKPHKKKSISVHYISENNQWLINNPYGNLSVDWQLYSNEGSVVDSRVLALNPGLNYFSSKAPTGLFIYQLTSEKESQMGKVLVGKIHP